MSSITQTITGSDNQVLAAGRDVYQVSLHFAEATPEDRHNLRNLLELVRQTWINKTLGHSVHQAALLKLRMQALPSVIERPWARVLDAAGEHDEVFSVGTTISQVFDEAGRTLLILGMPGAGKTSTLLSLARELVERADRDASAPVPVVFSLATWVKSRKSIHDWLVGELFKYYRTGRPLALRWLEQHRLLLLLDGLDEVVEEHRAACVEALHAFVEEHGISGLAICCRRAEYLELPLKLKLGGAVSLLPLTQEQIAAYLDAASEKVGGLRTALARNAELRALAESPLMLNIMSIAFSGAPADALRFDQALTREALRDEIFARYVDLMFVLRERMDNAYSRQKMEVWLRWLASGMMRRGETIVAIDLLQPAWLTTRPLLLYTLVSRVMGGMATTAAIATIVCITIHLLLLIQDKPTSAVGAQWLIVSLGVAMAFGLVLGFCYAPFEYLRLRRSCGAEARSQSMVEELGLFACYGLIFLLVAWLVLAVAMVGLNRSLQEVGPALFAIMVSGVSFPLLFGKKPGRGDAYRDVSLVRTLTWHWRSALEITVAGVLAGAVLLPVAPWFGATRVAAGALSAISIFATAMYRGWRHEVPRIDAWNERPVISTLVSSARVFACASLAWVLVLVAVTWYIAGPEMAFGTLILAVFSASLLFSPALFWFGGLDVVLHASLRLTLSLIGALPLRLRRFLDYAVHLGFLQRAGGGYIFFHRLLLEHFAALPASDAGSAPKPPVSPIIGQSARPAGP
jgi:DNA polymerase III delta prime subunit